MKHLSNYIYLGIFTQSKQCCIIYAPTELTSENLKMQKPNFLYAATSWGGHDSIENTLSKGGLKLSVPSFELCGTYIGYDADMGYTKPFYFYYNRVVKVEEI